MNPDDHPRAPRDAQPEARASASAPPAADGFRRPPLTSLRGDAAFRRVRARGKVGRTALLSFRWVPCRRFEAAIGIVVSKKVGKAVVRNRVRRRLREAARRMDWPPMEAMVVVQPEAAAATYAQLVRSLSIAAGKSGIR